MAMVPVGLGGSCGLPVLSLVLTHYDRKVVCRKVGMSQIINVLSYLIFSSVVQVNSVGIWLCLSSPVPSP